MTRYGTLRRLAVLGLAKKLQNPVADLVSVPLQHNWDFSIGPEEAIVWPADANELTHEPELALVIGRPCRNVTPEEVVLLRQIRDALKK